ncbi:MAG: DUF4249 domain-containing protein [Prolixibacteraceae bacterium]|jgi:hypothetical protein|nr:DUF4249 domain-containing protein [Prolixibacteraceae bacterium]
MGKHYFILLFFVFGACIKEVDISTEQISKQLVVNCFFTERKAFKVHISHLAVYPDTTDRIIDNATVNIYAGAVWLGTLPFVGKGLYSDNSIVPHQGIMYSIEVSVPGYQTVTATDSLPPPVPVKHASILRNAGLYDDGLSYDEISITFKDEIGKNYYSVMIYNSLPPNGLEYDKYLIELFSSDPAVVSEGTGQGDFPKFLVFNDALFEGKEYKFRLNIGSFSGVKNAFVHLESGSYAYYQYRKRLLKHHPYSYESPFEPYIPTPLYSNLKNGLGIFAGYQESIWQIISEN